MVALNGIRFDLTAIYGSRCFLVLFKTMFDHENSDAKLTHWLRPCACSVPVVSYARCMLADLCTLCASCMASSLDPWPFYGRIETGKLQEPFCNANFRRNNRPVFHWCVSKAETRQTAASTPFRQIACLPVSGERRTVSPADQNSGQAIAHSFN